MKMNNDDFMNFVGYQQYGGGSDPGSGGGGGGSGCGSNILVYVVLFLVLCYILGSCGA